MTHPSRPQQGFSLIEMLMVVLILSIITGIVFNYIAVVQQRFKTEEARLDVQQESREFLDQIVRDLHTAGYPNFRMYATGPATPQTSPQLAVGLVAASSSDILFEGDVDGDGAVNSMRYTLMTTTPNQCPCTIGRSDQPKVAGDPRSTDMGGAQGIRYATQLQNVVNSVGGAPFNTNTPFTIAGMTRFGGTSNDTYYGTYKQAPIFEFLDANGAVVNVPANLSTPANVAAGQAAAATIRQINIVINVLSQTEDQRTGVRPAASMRATVRLSNL